MLARWRKDKVAEPSNGNSGEDIRIDDQVRIARWNQTVSGRDNEAHDEMLSSLPAQLPPPPQLPPPQPPSKSFVRGRDNEVHDEMLSFMPAQLPPPPPSKSQESQLPRVACDPPPPPSQKKLASVSLPADGKTVASMARKGDDTLCEYLRKLAPDDLERLKRCALCESSAYGLVNSVALLLEWRADPNDPRPNTNKNALHEACAGNCSKEGAAIPLLIAARADPESKGKHKATPRGLAKKSGLEHLLPPAPVEVKEVKEVAKEELCRNFKDLDEICSELAKLKENLKPPVSMVGAPVAATAFGEANVDASSLPSASSPRKSLALEWLSGLCDEDDHLNEALREDLGAPPPLQSEKDGAMWTWQPPGQGKSFWRSYTQRYEPAKTRPKASRQMLPIDKDKQNIIDIVQRHPIVVLRGETGSGKSTQVPQLLLDAWGEEASVVVCQPRRIAAISLATRVAHERGEELGYSVGYYIGGEQVPAWPSGSVSFCTEGTLLRRLRNGASGVSHFILDEAHERSMDLDLLFCILRTVVSRHSIVQSEIDGEVIGLSGPRLIVMSATVDTLRMVKYFQEELAEGLEVGTVDVPGKLFPIYEYYLEDIFKSFAESYQDFVPNCKLADKSCSAAGVWTAANGNAKWPLGRVEDEQAAEDVVASVRAVDDRYIPLGIAVAMIKERVNLGSDFSVHDSNSILVFLPGVAEIKAARDLLLKDPVIDSGCVVIDLHSRAGPESRNAAFGKAPPGKIKVILATNVAETSLTIPDIDWVIDSGLMRVQDHGTLQTIWAGKSNVKQRRGRSGRVRNGEYFALFTRERQASLVENVPPEIQRESLSRVLLLTLEMGVSSRELLLSTMDPPTEEQMVAAEEELQQIGAISPSKEITGLGRVLNALVLEPRMGLALVAALVLGREIEMALLLAVIGSSPAITNVVDDSPLFGDTSGKEVISMSCRSDLFSAAMALCVVLDGEGEERRSTIEALKIPVHEIARTVTLAEQLLGALTRYSGNWRFSYADAFKNLRNHAPELSALLAFGFGNCIALDRGVSTMRVSSGKGKVGRESRWPVTKSMQEDETCILLYGSTVPTQVGWKSSYLICKDITQTALLAVLLFSTSLKREAEASLEVDGWLRVKGFGEEECKLIQTVSMQLQDLLAECCNQLTNGRSWKSIQDQQDAEDEHSHHLHCAREVLPTLLNLAWRSEKTDLPPPAPPPEKTTDVSPTKKQTQSFTSSLCDMEPAPGMDFIMEWLLKAHNDQQKKREEEELLRHAQAQLLQQSRDEEQAAQEARMKIKQKSEEVGIKSDDLDAFIRQQLRHVRGLKKKDAAVFHAKKQVEQLRLQEESARTCGIDPPGARSGIHPKTTRIEHSNFADSLPAFTSPVDGTSIPEIWQDRAIDPEELQSGLLRCSAGDYDTSEMLGREAQDEGKIGNNRVRAFPAGPISNSRVQFERAPGKVITTSSECTTVFDDAEVDSSEVSGDQVTQKPWTTAIATLMIRNIPARFTVAELSEIWPPENSYNILHLHYNQRLKRTTGIAIVNFVSHSAACRFRDEWQGKKLHSESTIKGLSIVAADVQGFAANVYMIKKTCQNLNGKYMPLILQPDETAYARSYAKHRGPNEQEDLEQKQASLVNEDHSYYSSASSHRQTWSDEQWWHRGYDSSPTRESTWYQRDHHDYPPSSSYENSWYRWDQRTDRPSAW